MFIKNQSFFGGVKKVNDEALSQLSSFMSIGNEIELNIVNDLTKAVCIYEYGPALSIVELEHFLNQFKQKIYEFRQDCDEIFCQLFLCICNENDTEYIIRNTCVLIFKSPRCILLKFGEIKHIKYVIQIDNHTLYELGIKPTTTPYHPESYPAIKGKYDELKIKMMEVNATRIIKNITGFEKHLTIRRTSNAEEAKQNVESARDYESAFKNILGDLNTSYKALEDEKEKK